MSPEAVFPSESLRSLHEVRKFVTRVWEHPLIDEETRIFRQELLKYF